MSPLFLPLPCLGQAHVCQRGRRAGQVTLRLSGGQRVSQIPFLPGRNWGSTSRSCRPVTAADFLVGHGPRSRRPCSSLLPVYLICSKQMRFPGGGGGRFEVKVQERVVFIQTRSAHLSQSLLHYQMFSGSYGN